MGLAGLGLSVPHGITHARTPAAAVMYRRGVRVIDLVAAMHAELRRDEWHAERFRSERGAVHRVTRILTGRLKPSLSEACAIAHVLGVPSAELFPEVETGPHPLASSRCEPAWSWSTNGKPPARHPRAGVHYPT